MLDGVQATTETASELVEDKARRIAMLTLIGAGALSTVAQFEHTFDHAGVLLEFLQGSGRHFIVDYIGAMAALLKSKASSASEIIAATVLGGMAGDIAAEAGQAVVITGVYHWGWAHVGDFMLPKEVFWGNAKDAGAAVLAAAGASAQQVLKD